MSSLAFMKANFLPAAATFVQSMTPCQWLMSMPSVYGDGGDGVGGGVGVGVGVGVDAGVGFGVALGVAVGAAAGVGVGVGAGVDVVVSVVLNRPAAA
jgi:hypothetical protein